MEDEYLKKRRDDRTSEEFASDIQKGSTREQYWAFIFSMDMKTRGIRCSYQDHGVDNTGKVIQGRLANANADFIFFGILQTPLRIEIKHNWPNCHYMTFKKKNLVAILSQGAHILVPTIVGYHILFAGAIREIMSVCRERYDIMNGKACYRPGLGRSEEAIKAGLKAKILPEELSLIDRLVDEGQVVHREWTPAAKKKIKKYLHVLNMSTSGKVR